MSENIFAQEWIECLEAHYIHVIRTKDKVTEPSLTVVMHSAGFSDQQLAELRVRATMHVDDVGADFVPDLHVFDGHDHHAAPVEPAEATVFNIPVDLAPIAPEARPETVIVEVSAALDDAIEPSELLSEPNDELTVADVDDEPVELESGTEATAPPDPDAPQQLSLF